MGRKCNTIQNDESHSRYDSRRTLLDKVDGMMKTSQYDANRSELPYDRTNKESIVYYAMDLKGRTLREAAGVERIDDPVVRRGSFGNAVEYYYFKFDPNNDPNPDFNEVGIELKTTPLKRTKRGDLVSKERLVLSKISYMNVVDETWETSAVLKKCSDILLLFYLYVPDVNPVDYEFYLVELWSIPEEDVPTVRQDWETIVEKVRQGRAHEISGSDTLYLEACTKAANSDVRTKQPFSDVPAKPRAWALKQSYMTAVSNKLLQAQAIERTDAQRELPLLELVRARFVPYFGKTEDELARMFDIVKPNARKPKSLGAMITRRILGIDEDSRILEFEKAGIKTKTMRLRRSGMLKESVSFPAFDNFKVAETAFEDSDFHEQLEQKYLFVIYRESETESGRFLLDDVMFWQMPEADLPEARRCYDEMQRRIRMGKAEDSVKSSENRCCHVRPHGRDSQDTIPTPQGDEVVKRSFWLNQAYLKDEIARGLEEREQQRC